MDAELLELQRQFESAQQAKSSIRLSERNVVELVHKLQELQIIDFELLHTVSGKEYITPDQLRVEIEAEIAKSGRVSLIDLADIIGVDLYHVEKKAKQIVTDNAGLMLVQGEIISQFYWDTIAEEINERLQECSQIALAELAAQLHISSELIFTVLEPRLGTLVKGRLEGGQIYTPAYIERVTAMVRGAARGITVPTNLSMVWISLQQLLQEMDGASGVSIESAFFQSLFNGLVKEGEILGSVRAGIHWTPAVFAHAQKESVDSFFFQNSFISYDVLYKLAISQPKQYLQSRYPEGISLDTVFVHPSVIEMLDAAIEDAIEQGGWIDCLSVLPAVYGSPDASTLLSLCPSVQRAVKSMRATILGESCVFSNAFIKDVFDQIDEEMETFNHKKLSGQGLSDSSHSVNEYKAGPDLGHLPELNETAENDSGNKQFVDKGSKKKRGKAVGPKSGSAENSSDNPETIPSKSKKNQRKNRDAGSLPATDAKCGGKKDSNNMKEEILRTISEEWIMQKILQFFPDFEGLGGQDDQKMLLRPLAVHLRPMLLTSWKERRNAVLMENAEKRRRLLDNLQKKLDESFFDLQLYEKALDLFEDDPSTSVILHKHLLKSTATSIMDTLMLNLDMDNKLKNGIEYEESQNQEPATLTSSDKISLAKSLPGSLSSKAVAAVEALEGKGMPRSMPSLLKFIMSYDLTSSTDPKIIVQNLSSQRMDIFINALWAVAEESGLILKKLDKKLERTLLHSYRKDLTSQVSSETDPVALLPKVVSLLYLQVHNKALQAPGRAISIAISRLKNKMDDSAHKVLVDYQAATVTLLALQSATTDDKEDCTSDRIMTKREFLESQMPGLKALVLNNTRT